MRISDWSSDVCSSDLSPASASSSSARSRGGRAATAGWATRACSTLGTGDGTRDSGCGGKVYTSRLPTRGTDHALVDPARVHPAAWLHAARFRTVHRRAAADRAGDDRRTVQGRRPGRSEEHTSELQSLMRISYAVLCL